MNLHSNAALTMKQRKHLHQLYATGAHTQASLARQFGTTRKTIRKWLSRSDAEDKSCAPKNPHRTVSENY
jgi:transposase-like protein